MSIYGGPDIVTNGLVLHLDAANNKSYPGSGTTWFDLSGNNNHGTLVNGPAYSSINTGIFILDGVNDYINIPINLTNTQYTIIAAARYSSSINTKRIITSITGNWLMGWWNGQTNKYYAENWVSDVSGGVVETSWISYAGTGNYSADSWSLYRNGVLLIGPNANGINGPNGIRIGESGSYGERSACEISYILVYNRVLTASEILQNYNATKGRYGL